MQLLEMKGVECGSGRERREVGKKGFLLVHHARCDPHALEKFHARSE